MSTIAIVNGVLEGLELASHLAAAASQVSAAVLKAQQTGQPVDYTDILGNLDTAEARVLTSIAAAKESGR